MRNDNRPVDQWHLDSVPYVLVLLLSDSRDLVGGKLMVALLGDPCETIDKINLGLISPEDIEEVEYPGAGYAIFMQGSKIAHAVSAVTAAREPRMTVVNSYQSLNPFSSDRTIFSTFNHLEGKRAQYEFARAFPLGCLLYTSPSPRDRTRSRMPSSA